MTSPMITSESRFPLPVGGLYHQPGRRTSLLSQLVRGLPDDLIQALGRNKLYRGV